MKKRFYIITTFILSAAVLITSSCLKDPRAQDFSNVGTLIELPLAAYAGAGNMVAEAFPIQTTPQSFPLVINVAAPKPLTSALPVTLKLNTDSLTRLNANLLATFLADSAAYANDQTGTVAQPIPLIQYALPPSGSYTISTLTPTIPANQHTVSITLSVITSLLNPASHYAIPLTLIGASGQKISNYNTVFFAPQPKNDYDGVYTVKGYVHRDLDMSLGGPYTKAGLTTALATTAKYTVSYVPTWADGSGVAGIDGITLTVNPNTNAVTIVCATNPTLVPIPGSNNHYDPVKKIFYVAFVYNGTDINHRSHLDTLTYKGVRP